MSGASETWRVRHSDECTEAVTVTRCRRRWRVENADRDSWSVSPTARGAVEEALSVPPAFVFGPGETPEERAAFARGVEAMRASAVAVCLAEGDASVKDAEKATEGDALALARWSAATSLMLSRNIEAITIEPEAAK